MWWKYAGFGQFMILNQLKEDTFEEGDDGRKTHVHPGQLTEVRMSGRSINTILGSQKTVVVSLNERLLQKPGTSGQFNLGWKLLMGPPVPNTWSFDYSIYGPKNEHEAVSGRIAIPTPRGRRSIMRFTFHYALDDHHNVWYAVKADSLDWRNETWEMGSTTLLGDTPAVRATSPAHTG